MKRRYPATAYDREMPDGADSWKLTERDVNQMQVATELAHALHNGIPLRGGPLPPQRIDGTMGTEDGTAISIVWGSNEYEDGSRRVLGWYESSR